MTLALLWEEYRGQHPDGYGYSRFCDLYGEWRRGDDGDHAPDPRGRREAVRGLRRRHRAGVRRAHRGGPRRQDLRRGPGSVELHLSSEARFSEALPDWIGAHVNALAFLGGVPKALVCDNLKAGVTTASRYEPGVNRTYQDLAAHYGTTIMPTRPRKPRDKAKVEAAVLIVERWILARLRNRRFFSLAELNVAIRIAGRRTQCPPDAQARCQPP